MKVGGVYMVEAAGLMIDRGRLGRGYKAHLEHQVLHLWFGGELSWFSAGSIC